MKNNNEKKENPMSHRVLAGILVGLIVFGVVAGLLFYVLG